MSKAFQDAFGDAFPYGAADGPIDVYTTCVIPKEKRHGNEKRDDQAANQEGNH